MGSVGVGGGEGGVLRPLNDWNPPLVEDVSPNVELSILQSGLKTQSWGPKKSHQWDDQTIFGAGLMFSGFFNNIKHLSK